MPRIIFRADAGWRPGTGHVMRCLTLADALRDAGVECRFVCRQHAGHMAATIEQAGFPVDLIEMAPGYADREDYEGWRGGSLANDVLLTRQAIQSAGCCDGLIVDHYGLGAKYESALRPMVKMIAVFDDLHDRQRDCDLLIDQNVGHSETMFSGLVPAGACVLAGSQYAPLRKEFSLLRESSLTRRRGIVSSARLLVAIGGSDQLNVTSKILETIENASQYGLEWIEQADIVLAGIAPHLEEIKSSVNRNSKAVLHVDTHDMPRLMSECDIAIGGGGVTAIERCVMGLPTLIVVMAENQESVARRLEDLGATITLGHGLDVRPQAIAAVLNRIRSDATLYSNMIERSASLCDGQGLARIVPHILGLIHPRSA